MKSPQEMQEIRKCHNKASEGIDDLMGLMEELLQRPKCKPSKVILVDDDRSFLKTFAHYCEANGYAPEKLKLVTACDTNELKAVLKDNGDPVILMDLHLGLDDGLEIADRLSLPEKYKVYFISGTAPSAETTHRMESMGAKFHLKTSNLSEYTPLIEEILRA